MLYHLYIAPKSRQASVAAQWLPAGAIGKKKNARALYLDLTPATKVICELGGKRRARALPSFLVYSAVGWVKAYDIYAVAVRRTCPVLVVRYLQYVKNKKA